MTVIKQVQSQFVIWSNWIYKNYNCPFINWTGVFCKQQHRKV